MQGSGFLGWLLKIVGKSSIVIHAGHCPFIYSVSEEILVSCPESSQSV